MKKRKLNYRFHNPNTAEVTADYLLKILIEQMQVRWNRQYKKQRMSFPMNQNMMEGVLRSAWDCLLFFCYCLCSV